MTKWVHDIIKWKKKDTAFLPDIFLKRVALFFFVLLSNSICAQSPETYTIKPGEKILHVISAKDIYSYPDFAKGTVIFRDGRLVAGRLNYNMLISAIQFIDAKGDTLSLAEENTIRLVIIKEDSFCFDNGYLELIAGDAAVKLGRKVYFKEFEQKPGAYGLSSGTTAAVTLSSILEKKAFDLNIEQELVLMKSTDYFFGNRNHFLPAEKKNILKLFPKHKTNITGYLNSNSVNFKKEKDLLLLTSFLQGL